MCVYSPENGMVKDEEAKEEAKGDQAKLPIYYGEKEIDNCVWWCGFNRPSSHSRHLASGQKRIRRLG